MYKIFLSALVLLLLFLLASCVTTPVVLDGAETTQDSTQATTLETVETQENPVEEQTTEHMQDDTTTIETETQQITEEQTTYGELHFPETE